VNRPLYLLAAVVLLVCWLPAMAVGLRGRPVDGVVAVQVAGALTTSVLVCMAVGLHQSSFASVALVAAVAAAVGGLVWARFLDREP
jgi:multisubunit Na+/H+ antiporter MnhF subunit